MPTCSLRPSAQCSPDGPPHDVLLVQATAGPWRTAECRRRHCCPLCTQERGHGRRGGNQRVRGKSSLIGLATPSPVTWGGGSERSLPLLQGVTRAVTRAVTSAAEVWEAKSGCRGSPRVCPIQGGGLHERRALPTSHPHTRARTFREELDLVRLRISMDLQPPREYHITIGSRKSHHLLIQP